MFVNRRASHTKPGLKDNQIYLPQKRQALFPEFPPIRSKYMAEYYFNQLRRLGYIPDPPAPPEPSPNNVLISTVTSSDGTYLDINSNTGLLSLSGADLEEGAIDPMPDPNVQYNVSLVSGASITFVAQNQTRVWNYEFTFEGQDSNYLTNNIDTTSVTIANVASFHSVLSEGIHFLMVTQTNGNIYMLLSENNTWRIDLSPVQTLMFIRFTPVEEP